MMSNARVLAAALCLAAGACASTAITRESVIPVPDHPAPAAVTELERGAPRDSARIPPRDQLLIYREVVRRFFLPMMQQARWIDPRPLAHERTRHADSLVAPDLDRAIVIATTIDRDRVCPLTEANSRCRGYAGGVLRFSAAYGVGSQTTMGADSALVYVAYQPVSGGYGAASEIEFFVARDGASWNVVSKRSLPEVADRAPQRRIVVDPQEAVDSLLAADRAFATVARDTTLVAGLSAMFVSNVVLQTPGGHVHGQDAAIRALGADTSDRQSRVTWTPVVGGVSSDGQQGFTLGYITVTRRGGTAVPGRYVAYWVRGETGWRVAAYKRVPRPAGTVSMDLLPASLPIKALPIGDAASVQRWADELSLAEHAFSRDAGSMGLGPAFEKWGAPDAVNIGGPGDTSFVHGPRAIARSVSAGISPDVAVSWAPDQVIVSRTGDLGVSIGTIRITAGAEGAEPVTRVVPFFTVWKRAWPTDPWRYVAE